MTVNADGTSKISCEDGTSVTINNGADGKVGDKGDKGDKGGDGTNCTVKDNGDGTKTITCDDGTKVTVADGKPCTVTDNGDGTSTIDCKDGTKTTVKNGADGTPGKAGGNVAITDHHGTDHLLSSGEFATAGKKFVNATITKATADVAGKVTVEFKVEDADKKPVLGLPRVNASIVKLVPASGGESFSKWVAYIYRTQTVKDSASNSWPAKDGDKADQAYRENDGTLTDNKDGTYVYVFKTDLTKAMRNGQSVKYERNLTHRVSITMGGHSGPTASAEFDFVPDGTAISARRNIIDTSSCKNCHGVEFHGHGGDRITVGNCVTCHAPGNIDPHSKNTLDMKVMIHKIHAGGDLPTVKGPDGKVFDDPGTTVDETKDNGEYKIWGHRDRGHSWEKVAFPAVLSNCTKCHRGSGQQKDNWKTVPSRAACGSCHDNIDWTNGTNHSAGAQTDDTKCAGCHPATGTKIAITEAHDWTKKDVRNIPEFTVDLTVSAPGNGKFFVKGEKPIVSVVIKKDGTPIDHTTVLKDTDGKEGCTGDPCPAADGKFDHAYLMVHSRGRRVPVLSTAARVEVVAPAAGPYDLSAQGASLSLKVDAGANVYAKDSSGGDVVISGNITVAVPATGSFADKSQATAVEIVAWLNADATFAARAIAYLEGGRPAIRSRNLGRLFALQLMAGPVTSAVFGGNTAEQVVGGTYPRNELAKHASAVDDDPKVKWETGRITYELDPVDDLKPGTYVASVEITDRGRIDGTNYKTPSVAKVTFQVGTATEQKPVANNCNTCHQNDAGKGFILDFPRHYKVFDNTALDQCGACHDYQPRQSTGTAWAGAKPMSKRIHAIHFGSSLDFPLATVDYSRGDPKKGRNWDITLPLDVRNCEMCHTKTGSSGTWKTNPGRLACWGCHDSLASQAHMKLMTFDPTPNNPWSGDEQTSCKTCH